MKRYKKIDLQYHYGHPFEHSTWVAYESKIFSELLNCAPYRKGIKLYESQKRDIKDKALRRKLLHYFRETFSNKAAIA